MNQDNNFMDSKTLWAILLVGVVWFGWQQYINKKYGDTTSVQNKDAVVDSSKNTPQVAAPAEAVKTAEIQNPDKKVSAVPEQKVSYANPLLKLEISSQGMALKNVELAKFIGRDDKPVHFSGGEKGLFSTIIGGSIPHFNITKADEHSYIGEAEYDGIKIQKKLTFSNNYNVSIETKIDSASRPIPNVSMTLEEDVKKLDAGSIFSPPQEIQEIVVLNQEGEKDFNLAKETDGINTTVNQAFLASINGHYFSTAFIDKSEIIPNFSIEHKNNSPFVKGSLNYNLNNDHKYLVLKGIGFFGPKDTTILESVDPLLPKVVRFGFFSAIAKPLLATMKWLNSVLGNWGWSIILLTLLVRMIVMPLHIMSFKSMKAMQKVQPLIQNIKERYKDDPMALNRETMALMKKHKVNPMGGCLPMLLQIPVFFALYRVFSESLELYRSPFIFWIHDLSLKDPYYVLPVLMAAVMYLQQKMTPSTMDPAQAKIMQYMPLVFSLMMVSLPSALTLYMFVSTFFGIIQQYLFLKDKNSVELAKIA